MTAPTPGELKMKDAKTTEQPSKLSGAHQDILKPHADALYAIHQAVHKSSDDELNKLEAACKAASTTNCWAETYGAAQILLDEIKRARLFRSTPSNRG